MRDLGVLRPGTVLPYELAESPLHRHTASCCACMIEPFGTDGRFCIVCEQHALAHNLCSYVRNEAVLCVLHIATSSVVARDFANFVIIWKVGCLY